MANVMSHGDADRLTKEQELHDTEAREAQRADLYERVAAIAGGKKSEGENPERGRAKSEPTGAKELGQQALGLPPLDGTGGTAEEAEAAINAILSEERKRETF